MAMRSPRPCGAVDGHRRRNRRRRGGWTCRASDKNRAARGEYAPPNGHQVGEKPQLAGPFAFLC
jgi:hypothetical protein